MKTRVSWFPWMALALGATVVACGGTDGTNDLFAGGGVGGVAGVGGAAGASQAGVGGAGPAGAGGQSGKGGAGNANGGSAGVGGSAGFSGTGGSAQNDGGGNGGSGASGNDASSDAVDEATPDGASGAGGAGGTGGTPVDGSSGTGGSAPDASDGAAGSGGTVTVDAGPDVIKLDATPDVIHLDATPDVIKLDATPDVAKDAPVPVLECGDGVTCVLATQACCVKGSTNGFTESCIDANASGSTCAATRNSRIRCTGPADCPGQVCCGDYVGVGVGGTGANSYYSQLRCADSCDTSTGGGQVQFCDPNAAQPCPNTACTQSNFLPAGYFVCSNT